MPIDMSNLSRVLAVVSDKLLRRGEIFNLSADFVQLVERLLESLLDGLQHGVLAHEANNGGDDAEHGQHAAKASGETLVS